MTLDFRSHPYIARSGPERGHPKSRSIRPIPQRHTMISLLLAVTAPTGTQLAISEDLQ